MSTLGSEYQQPVLTDAAATRDRTHELLGQVMGLVAVAVGFAALGAYIGRDLSGGTGLLFFICAFGCIIGPNVAAAKGPEQAALAPLFGMRRMLRVAVAPVIGPDAHRHHAAPWDGAGAPR